MAGVILQPHYEFDIYSGIYMPYEIVIKSSKKIEALLSELGATGKGLHEKATSIESQLSYSLVKKIRYLASVRNQLVHEDGFEISDEGVEQYRAISEQVYDLLFINTSNMEPLDDSWNPVIDSPTCHQKSTIALRLSVAIDNVIHYWLKRIFVGLLGALSGALLLLVLIIGLK